MRDIICHESFMAPIDALRIDSNSDFCAVKFSERITVEFLVEC
jgi:hypothetical protein